MKLALQSLLVFLALFAGYHFALRRLPALLRSDDMAGSQPERNLMRAQAYCYTRNDPPVVIVGSSISERLNDVPGNWYKLAFPGLNAYTGLEVVLRGGKHPRYVLIETNVLNMEPDARMLDSLFFPVLKSARSRLPELMEQSKPSHVAVRALAMDRPAKSGAATTSATPMSPEFFDALVRRRLEELAKPLDPPRLDEIMARLRGYVAELQKGGVQVIFFEMPELAAGEDSPLKTSIRNRVRGEFPAPQFRWVPDVDANAFKTTDAIHLNRESAKRYCAILADYMASVDATTVENGPSLISPGVASEAASMRQR